LDEKEIVKQMLDSYDEVSVIGEDDDIIFFLLKGKEYGFWYSTIEDATGSPIILVKNEDKYNYPHIMPLGIPLDKNKKDKYRFICLHENGSYIRFLQTYEEKIIDAIDRLIELLSLTDLEIEEEFQKEFLYYWNDIAEEELKIKLYIGNDRTFKRINTYLGNNATVRMVANGIRLSDAEKTKDGNKIWRHQPELPAFYIPITDNRRILPPTRGKKWDAKNILMIINGREYSRISSETYMRMSKEKVKTAYVSLVFEMLVNGNSINFTSIVLFKSATNDTLLNKLKNEIKEVRIVKSKRVDYYHLSRQIGNDTSLIGKKVLLVGAGSLGSYVAKELVKAGICNLTIYDSDTLEDENVLRHNADSVWIGCNKAIALKYDLEYIHPEICVNAFQKDIDESLLKEEMVKNDLVIFTVGSSDIQLASNRVFKKEKYDKPVIYTWLEAGGADSHILTVDYLKEGCFECLFTNEEGELVNNKANNLTDAIVESKIIRNGCGATRVAYGNSILLRTSSTLLDTVKTVFAKEMYKNYLIDISPTKVIDHENQFIEGKCRCCGNRDRE